MCEYVEKLKQITKDLPSIDKHMRECCGSVDKEPAEKDSQDDKG